VCSKVENVLVALLSLLGGHRADTLQRQDRAQDRPNRLGTRRLGIFRVVPGAFFWQSKRTTAGSRRGDRRSRLPAGRENAGRQGRGYLDT
jgi:hypothetical protein